jgi:hypothetical protein
MSISGLEYALIKVGGHRNSILSNIISNVSLKKDIKDEVAQLEKFSELCLILVDKIKKNINEETNTELLYYALGIVGNYRESIFSNIMSLESLNYENCKQILDNEKIQLEKMNELCLILGDKIKKNLLVEVSDSHVKSNVKSTIAINATATSDAV